MIRRLTRKEFEAVGPTVGAQSWMTGERYIRPNATLPRPPLQVVVRSGRQMFACPETGCDFASASGVELTAHGARAHGQTEDYAQVERLRTTVQRSREGFRPRRVS